MHKVGLGLIYGDVYVCQTVSPLTYLENHTEKRHTLFSELTFTFANCLSVCLSVCLSSVTRVHPIQAVVNFSNVSTAFGTLAIRRHAQKILWRSSQGTPPRRGS